MKIELDRQHFLEKVDLLKGITKTKKDMPILRNVLIELPAGRMTATDLTITAITNIKTSYTGEPAKICVKGAPLEEVLCNLKGQNIDLEYPDNVPGGQFTGELTIAQDRAHVGIVISDPDEFPEMPVINDIETIKLPAKDILAGINKVFYAISRDETRYVLTGMLMEVRDHHLVVCGTDGFRMALWKKDLKDEDDTPQIVIAAANVKVIKETIDENSNVGIVIASEKVQLMTERVTIITRTISGAYPDYTAVIGTSLDNIAFIKRAELINAINFVSSVYVKDNRIRIQRVKDGEAEAVRVCMESDSGKAEITIDAKFKSAEPMYFAFNPKFLLDALEHLAGDEVLVRYPATYGAIVMEEDDYTCVIMPIRDGETPIEEAAAESRSQDAGSQASGKKRYNTKKGSEATA